MNTKEVLSTTKAMEYASTYLDGGGRSHGSTDGGGRGATRGRGLRPNVSLIIYNCVEKSTLTGYIDFTMVITAIAAPQHRAMKKNPTSRRRFQSAHARSNLHADMRNVSVRVAHNTDIRTGRVSVGQHKLRLYCSLSTVSTPSIVEYVLKSVIRRHLSEHGDQPMGCTRGLTVSRRRVCRRVEPVVCIYRGSNEGIIAILSVSLCHVPLFSVQRTTQNKIFVEENFVPVQIYWISWSLWPMLRVSKNLDELQGSQCDEIFVNEKSDCCNADLIMHSASSKISPDMTKGYIESGLCCTFDLNELRKRLYFIGEIHGFDHPMVPVA
jgi:hypothetical protein